MIAGSPLVGVVASVSGIWMLLIMCAMSIVKPRQKLLNHSLQRPYSPHFDRILLVVIDALRPDFLMDAQGRLNQDRFPLTHVFYEKREGSFLLRRMYADPPTTTTQRLQAIGTGNLPSLVEIGSTFAAEKIAEDNWIHQLHNDRNQNIVLLGDDTWQKLYGNVFSQELSFAESSFHIMDLDTVDHNIISRLDPVLKRKSEWTMLIAHFLGVDHCGHLHHIHHDQMKRKIAEMDSVIRNILGQVGTNELLIVMGDHGATETGDHGGAGTDETQTGFMAYSPRYENFTRNYTQLIDQIDLTPTLATMLGLPIPFCNLGSLIGGLVDSDNAEHHKTTTFQINTYLDAYMKSSSTSTQLRTDMQRLRDSYPRELLEHADSHLQYQKKILALFRKEFVSPNTKTEVLALAGLLVLAFLQTRTVVSLSCLQCGSRASCLSFLLVFLTIGSSNSFINHERAIVGCAGLLLSIDLALTGRPRQRCILVGLVAVCIRLMSALSASSSDVDDDWQYLRFLPLNFLTGFVINKLTARSTVGWGSLRMDIVRVLLTAVSILPGCAGLIWVRCGMDLSLGWRALSTVVVMLANVDSSRIISLSILIYDVLPYDCVETVLLSLSIAEFAFLSSGHRKRFSAVEWRVAFRFDHMMSPDWSYFLSETCVYRALLILVEMYSPALLCLRSFHLGPQVTEVQLDEVCFRKSAIRNDAANEPINGNALCSNAQHKRLSANLTCLVIMTWKVVTTSVFTCVLKRHLMAVEVFIPYWVFTLASYALISAYCVVDISVQIFSIWLDTYRFGQVCV